MNKKKKDHGKNPKRIVIAVLILIAVLFMLAGPRARAGEQKADIATTLIR